MSTVYRTAHLLELIYMQIAGLVPFSTTDWPGQISAVVFLQGCPWRCLYCHNPHLQPFSREVALDAPPSLSWTDVASLLEKRRGLLDAVVFSGGEPTMQPNLHRCVQEIQEMGFLVGLHTAGTNLSALAKVVSLVDWVALDIKALPDDYDGITSSRESSTAAFQCLSLIEGSAKSYEVRTTVHPEFLSEQQQLQLVELLASAGVRNYALQAYRTTGSALKLPVVPLSARVVSRCEELFESFSRREL